MLVVGLIFGGVGYYIGSETIAFTRTARSAQGEIVGVSERRDRDGDRMYAPIISFTPSEGDPVRFTGDTRSSWRPKVGEQVKVLYNPRNPEQARVDSFLELWVFPGVFGGVGALLVLIALGSMLRGLIIAALFARAATS